MLFHKQNVDLVQLASSMVKSNSSDIRMLKLASNPMNVRPNIVIFKNVYVFGEKKMPWQAANCFRILEFQWYSEYCHNFVMPGHRWKESKTLSF